MEGAVEAHASVPPMYCHHPALPVRGKYSGVDSAKKRAFPWPPSVGAAGTPVWDPQLWEWDCSRFVATPSAESGYELQLGCAHPRAVDAEAENRTEDGLTARTVSRQDDAAVCLNFKLADGPYLPPAVKAAAWPVRVASASTTAATVVETPRAHLQEPAARDQKHMRSGSPGNGDGRGGNYPMCQVDDCRADLSNAKDYHRRHKVCEVHSKAAKVLVGNQTERFCQQCSRFHPLSEFDEGKRSCRRRLAGHNQRRRKSQSMITNSPLLMQGIHGDAAKMSLDIMNLLAVIATLQGNNISKSSVGNPASDKDGVFNLFNKINSLTSTSLLMRSPTSEGFDLNVPQHVEEAENNNGFCGGQGAPATHNLLTVLSAALRGRADGCGSEKSKTHHREAGNDINLQVKSKPTVLSTISGNVSRGPMSLELHEQPVQEEQPRLLLKLFGSTVNDSHPKLDLGTKCLSSESSNPLDERSPSSSPPVTRRFFPLQSAMEEIHNTRLAEVRDDVATIEVSTSQAQCEPLELFKSSDQLCVPQNFPFTAGCASSSGSDHSASTSGSDGWDRTGRIVFKLFGKVPGNLPANLRDQIFNWLSKSPSEMESYIRPGCVVFTVYVTMPSRSWDELERNLPQHVNFLVQSSGSEFWRKGRFLVQAERRLVSHMDGMFRLSKSWGTWSSPKLKSVSPLAVVGGQKTTLVLKGHNLTVPGTKIHCTYLGKYVTKEILSSAYPGTIYDALSVENFDFPDDPTHLLGRSFIEVENGFKGNYFPVIIASFSICQELRSLEPEFEDALISNAALHDQTREGALHFLHELGWLFQKARNCIVNTNLPSGPTLLDFSVPRFKYLFLFAIERDWCAVMKMLLDFLAKRTLLTTESSDESLQMLSEVHLLNRAVQRRSKKMVDLLLQFAVVLPDNSKMFPFPPNFPGPGGLTPLHLAACSHNAEEIVNSLTSDPQQIGMSCWSSLLDDNGQSPQSYATSRNNHSYNILVHRKITGRINSCVSISVSDEISTGNSQIRLGGQTSQARPCKNCAVLRTRMRVQPCQSRGTLQRPYVHSVLAVAAVCLCVCVIMRALLRINSGRSLKWENIKYGSM